MGRELAINLIAKDNMSGPIRKITVATDELSDSLKSTGTTATTAGAATEKAGQQSARGIQQVGDAAEASYRKTQMLNAGLTVLGAGLLYSSNKAMEQERQIIGLTAAYGDYADEMLRFAQEMDDATIFTDDDIRAGERYFATLINNYDLTTEQIKQLMQATADLASASGTTYEDASSRVTAAIRGEGEAAEYLGLTMNQQAIDRNNLTLTMTNQEAAQFRLNALLQQSAVYEGTSANLMNSNIGIVSEWTDRIEDAGTGVGQLLGPLGAAATGVGTLGIGLTGLTTGFSFAAAGARTIGAALGPVGIAIGAVVLAGIGLYKIFNDTDEATQDYNASLLTLSDTIEVLRRQGDDMLAGQIESIENLITPMRELLDESELFTDWSERMGHPGIAAGDEGWEDLHAQWERYEADLDSAYSLTDDVMGKLNQAALDPNINVDAYFGWVEQTLKAADATETLADDAAALQIIMSRPVSDFAITRIGESMDTATISLKDFKDSFADLPTTLDDMRISGNGALADDIERLHGEWVGAFTLSPQEQAAALGLTEGTAEWSMVITSLTSATTIAGQEAVDLDTAWTRIFDNIASGNLDNVRLFADLMEILNDDSMSDQEKADAIEAISVSLYLYADAQGVLLAATDLLTQGMTGATAAMEAQKQVVIDNMNALLEVAGYGDPLSRWNLEGNATDMSLLAMNAQQASAALDSVYRVAVGNTDAIANQSDAIAQWAADLIGAQGEASKLDDLVRAGRISGESGVFTGDSQYAQAQRAYNDIARENAEIQEHVLTIQAKQAPLIRDQMVAYENYMQTIAELPANEQQVALAWADQATAGRALEFQTLAIAAANGELGANGEAMFTSMITGAAAADPYLSALLEDMGLISVGADGTITVNMDGVEGAKSEIALLTESIVKLGDLFDNGELDGTFNLNAEDNATDVVRTVRSERDELDGSSATVTVYANDQASGVLASIASKWGGTIATSFVDIITRNYTQQGTPGQALGGVVQPYAHGGVIVELAEAGPEILHFATGGTAYVGQRGIYAVEPGTYVSPNNAVGNTSYGGTTFNLNIAGPVYGFEDFEMRVAEAIAPVIAEAANQHLRGAGVS